MIEESLKDAIQKAVEATGMTAPLIALEHPGDVMHGDYSTNIALVLAKAAGLPPRTVAERIVAAWPGHERVARAEVAGPGFINFYLTRDFFTDQTAFILDAGDGWGRNKTLEGKKVLVEYTDPNPFKPFHIGHLMSNAIGESLSRLIAFGNAEVKRANYQGDVGLHVAKCLYPIVKKGWDDDSIEAIGKAYIEGAKLYEDDMEAKREIDDLNRTIYERSDERVNSAYVSGRALSLDHFEVIYRILGTTFDHYFFESESAPIGADIVRAHQDIFEKSDGATVFRGEVRDPSLHTRVFLNSEGLPTYEAKELGLMQMKMDVWPALDTSITVTAAEQDAYFRVVTRAAAEIFPAYAEKIVHVSHGMMQLTGGKMSSRKGNVITGESLIDDMRAAVLEKVEGRGLGAEKEEIINAIAVAAIKYSILKQASGKNIIFDPEKSLSFEGDSGPYLQYAHTRALSVLAKAKEEGIEADAGAPGEDATHLERFLYRFPEVALRALAERQPHHVTTYLIELAGIFNSWYAAEKIVDRLDSRSSYRIALTQAFEITMKNGLWLLGIQAPEKM